MAGNLGRGSATGKTSGSRRPGGISPTPASQKGGTAGTRSCRREDAGQPRIGGSGGRARWCIGEGGGGGTRRVRAPLVMTAGRDRGGGARSDAGGAPPGRPTRRCGEEGSPDPPPGRASPAARPPGRAPTSHPQAGHQPRGPAGGEESRATGGRPRRRRHDAGFARWWPRVVARGLAGAGGPAAAQLGAAGRVAYPRRRGGEREQDCDTGQLPSWTPF
nr:translation initiation factor IF-2-like [Aegilops tauschii subsp. strangulata]